MRSSARSTAPVVAAITGRRRDHVLFSSQLIIGVGYGCVLVASLASPGLSLAVALLAAVLVTTAELIQGPAVSAIVNESAGDQDRGRYISVYQMTFSIVDIIAPVALTTALTHGPFATWLPLIVIAALDAVVVLLLSRHLSALTLRIGHATATDPITRPIEADGL